ncbi:hypothetical protein N7468_000803 [Penicillium chermesinum]|uniref:LIM zinc-binding domain-containing protein n=1 Tax=Penicillium chermesinum TaxID=63820 RepID=A0A9W9PFK3_9EURO|nr:uncharacterized protein N7468_000803 [Penicillium chermesinum]KAJ5245820.1 hypothetical protein N7468_000803 [Penicillium chermesinum]
MAAKSGRSGALPRIDPTIANNAYLQPNVPTPASSIGSHLPSPINSAPRSPIQLSPHELPGSETLASPDGSVIDLDSVFNFPMPGNRESTRVSVSGLNAPPRSARTPSPGLGLNLAPKNVPLPPSPLPPHAERRGLSTGLVRKTSLASTRNGSSTARSSTYSFSRGFRTLIDEKPPMPPAPLRTPNKASFSRDSDVSAGSTYPSDQEDAYSGFDFGLSAEPASTPLHDLPEEPTPIEEPNADQQETFPFPPQNHLHPTDAELGADAPRKPSDATSEGAFSITSFARALGLEDYAAEEGNSLSSEASHPASEHGSGSSMSSLSSNASMNRRKMEDPLNLGPLVQQLPARTRQTIVELPGRVRSTMEEVPPIPAAFFSPDSPTDPAIGQGSLSLIREKTDQKSLVSPVQEQPEPPSIPDGNCKGCGEAITGKSISSSDGRLTGRYHRGCFVCYECNSPFQSTDFYVLNNLPYCAQHYHERNGSLCSTCHLGIEGHYLETVEQNYNRPERRRFHPECLQCRTCHVLLKDDYFEWNGGIFCERDARRAAASYYPPPPGRRRPTIGSSPLAPPRGYPPGPGYGPPPPHGPGPGSRLGPRYPPGPPGAMRIPERRTTKLMMA